MIITIVCDVLGKENNGTTIAAMNLIRYLKSKGHEVRILCGDQDKKDVDGYYIVPNINFGNLLNKYVEKVGVTLAKPDKSIIKKAIKDVDLIHIMVPLSLGLATIKMVREMNLDIPITAGFHMQAENLTSHFKVDKINFVNKKVYKVIYNHLYQYVDGIHYPTQFIKETFEKNIKKETPAYIISNGVNEQIKRIKIDKPQELEDKIVLLSIGRLGREKSQDTLIKAIYKSKYRDKIKLICAGQGPFENKYRKLAKNLPIQPDFKLFSRKDVIDVINYCDLYVHPADIELEGIACLEAIVCGKLTIVSDSKLSATKNFAIDDKCIFKKRNPSDLAKVIDFWIEHPELKQEYEKKYLDCAENYNQTKCMEKMEQMMFDVIEKHNKINL